jgi:hypothetical protein
MVSRQQLPFHVMPFEGAADLRDDAAAPLAHLAEFERFAEDGVEAVDQGQRGIGEQILHPEARSPSITLLQRCRSTLRRRRLRRGRGAES